MIKGNILPPSRDIGEKYKKSLLSLIKKMSRSYEYHLRVAYRKSEDKIVMDESPNSRMEDILNKLNRYWKKKFGISSEELAARFMEGTKKTTALSLNVSLDRMGVKVPFSDTRRLDDAFYALIKENVSLIKSIQQEYHLEVLGDVMRSISQGRDLSTLTKVLDRRFPITNRRAVIIARDQNNKATESLNRIRMQDLGITKAEWIHSRGGKEPRKSHVKADGKIYSLDKGCKIDGEFIYPGQKINCRCTMRPVIEAENE